MLRKEPIEKSGSTQKTLCHLQQSNPNLEQKNWFYPRQATNKKWKVQNGALRKTSCELKLEKVLAPDRRGFTFNLSLYINVQTYKRPRWLAFGSTRWYNVDSNLR